MKIQAAAIIGLVVLFSTSAQAQTPQQLLETGIAQLVTNPTQGKKLIRMAKEALQRDLKKLPENAYVHYLLGQTHFYLKQGKQALDSYATAIKLDPSKATYRFMHGIALRQAKKHKPAIGALSKATQLAPTIEKFWYELGDTHFQKGEHEQALKHFKQAISLNPKYESALYKAGVILAHQNQPDLAIQYWNMTVRANPKQIAAHHSLAQAYQTSGQVYQALFHFRKVVELNDKDWQARTKLVQLHQATDQRKERDTQRAALMALRTSATIPSLLQATNYCRDKFVVQGHNIYAIEYFDPKAQMGKRYAFKVMDSKNNAFLYEIRFGSYLSSNEIALEQGLIKPGERLFQLDRHEADGKHQAYAFYKQEPTYDQIKPIVIGIIEGKKENPNSQVHCVLFSLDFLTNATYYFFVLLATKKLVPILVLIWLGMARAQPNDDHDPHDPNEVTEIEEIIIQASRPQTASSDQVIRDEDFRYYPKRSASDLMRLVPGLWITQHTGGAKAHQVFLRGFDAEHGQDLVVEIDGIPLNESSHVHGQGYLDLHFLIPEVIERIRLIKGPYDAQHGNFATAGVIQFQTADDRSHTAQTKFSAGQYSSLGLTGELFLGDAQAGLLLALQADMTDGFTQPGQREAQRIFAKANSPLGHGWSVKALVAGYRARSQAADTLPLRWIRESKVHRFESLDDSNRVDVDRLLGGLTLQGPVWEGQLQATAWTNIKDTLIFSNYTFFYFDPTHGDQLEQSDQRSSGGVRLNHLRLFEWSEIGQISKIGLDWRIDDVTSLQARSQQRERFNLLNRYEFAEQLFSLWTSQEFQLSQRFRLIAGLRYDLQTIRARGTQDTETLDIRTNRKVIIEDAPRQANEVAHAISPKLSAVYTASQRLRLFANLGRGFVSRPARDQINEPRSMAVAVHGSELGLSWSSHQRILRLSGSLWWLHKDEERIFDPQTGSGVDRGASHRIGLELECRWAFASWAWLALDLFWLKPMLYTNQQWQALPNAPDLMASHMLGLKHPWGLNLSLRGRFLGPRHHDLGLTSDAVYLMDFTLGYSTDHLTLGLEIENLLNATWEDSVFAYPVRPTPTADIEQGLQVTPGSPFFARLYLSVRY